MIARSHDWLLGLPDGDFDERTIKMDEETAYRFVQTIRGAPPEKPKSSWSIAKSSLFGEDVVGGWLLENGGVVEGLEKGRLITIPPGGALARRRTDWLVGKRIIVEVKTYSGKVTKGGDLSVTRQFDDYARWRDNLAGRRAVVLARVVWKGNLTIEPLFREDLRHFHIPVIFFSW